jgi:hypothetical protein
MNKKGYLFVGVIVLACLVSGFTIHPDFLLTDAPPWEPDQYDVLCGNGSEADDYGFTYDLQQYHWTVNGERYLQSDTIDEIDKIFDQLVDDQVAETMILFKPADEVGNRVNCAVHFLRYMGLGNPSGERKDNGFVFLVVVEENAIDVHYGVGLGLPALTAHNLTDLNRMAEDIYADKGSMDDAILTMAYSYANYAREQYPAIASSNVVQPANDNNDNYTNENYGSEYSGSSLPLQIGGISAGALTCLCCISILILVMFVMILSGLRRPRRRYMPPVIRPMSPVWRPPSRGFGGGGFGGSIGGRSGGFSPPKMRGGSGSGRSGRGN